MRTRLLIAAAFVLIAGLAGGGTLYVLGEEPTPTAYLIVGDTAYPVDPATSKTYVRQIERFGGKAAVLFDDFNRWFAQRWQGKQLGVTLAALSAVVALLLAAIARRLPKDLR